MRCKFLPFQTVMAINGQVRKLNGGKVVKDFKVSLNGNQLGDNQVIAELDFIAHPLVIDFK